MKTQNDTAIQLSLFDTVAEQKLRTQRILGELIDEGQRKGIIANPGGGGDRISNVPERNNGQTLNEIGINRKQSSAFQQIASIPEEKFEEFIQEKKARAVSILYTPRL